MKNKKWLKKNLLSICMATSLFSSSVMLYAETTQDAKAETVTSENAESSEEAESIAQTTVEIHNVEEFLEFVDNCSYDRYSTGITFSLQEDLDLSGISYEGIPYFDGIFEGNGHTISSVTLSAKGSEYGFFRYIGENATVSDLNIAGAIQPEGTQEDIGGLAGVNYGTISNCSFTGKVSGQSAVGGLVGCNEETGIIVDSTSEAEILATNYTGGIAGKNKGTISGCTNNGSINTEELETTLDMGGVDLGTLNLTQNLVNRNDMGGIAGTSTGVISNCKNTGTIGFNHTGYNVGGIAGSQSGVILSCENEGEVYGRKDIGGIVGQSEPYIESEYLEDKLDETRSDITRLNNTLSGISTTLSNTSSEVKNSAEILNQQYTESMNSLSSSLDELTATAEQESPQAQEYVDNINNAMDRIEEIQSEEGTLSEEQVDEIQDQLSIINDNLGNVQSSYSGTEESAEDLVNNVSDQLKSGNENQSIVDIANSIDSGIQSITNSLNSAISQAESIVDSVQEDIESVTGGEDYIEDISSVETSEDVDGVISGCVNRGKITGDLNVGGIAGCMNMEYDADPEYDLDFTESTNITIRSTVNNVLIHCVNYGAINTKKNCAGGIAGLQELGFIYDCEGYGRVQSESGNYLGGIAGESEATIRGCYSFCNLEGNDYLGGICGSGQTMVENISICKIESEGERLGSIAGDVGEEGTISDNYYFSINGESDGAEICGIDGISYAGRAEARSYEEIVEMEGIPEGFSRVVITFESEDEVIDEISIAYGGSLTPEDFPEIEEKEGYYVSWDEGTSLEEIKENKTLTAEYVLWTQSVASNEKSEDKKSLFLITGEFYEDTTVTLEEADTDFSLEKDAQVEYAYTWSLCAEEEKEYEQLKGHFYIPTEAERTQVWIEKDGTWKEAKTTVDGSYLVADLEEGTAFAVVTLPETTNAGLYVLVAAGIVIIIVVAIFMKRKKRKRAKKEKGKE